MSVPFKSPVTVRFVIRYLFVEAINIGKVPAVVTLIVTGETSCACKLKLSNKQIANKSDLIVIFEFIVNNLSFPVPSG